MTDDPNNPERLRSIFSATLTDEPVLTDLVPDAVAGARIRIRRDRIAYGVTPLAIVGLAAGVYALAPAGGTGTGTGAGPAAGKTPGAHATSPAPKPSKPPATPGKKTAIPPLADPFARPGTPEENCRVTFPSATDATVPAADQAKERSRCATYLTALRTLLPHDTVVLDHEFRPGSDLQTIMPAIHDIATSDPGTKLPDLAKTIVEVLNDPANPNNGVNPYNFLVKTPTGVVALWFSAGADQGGQKSGTGDCHDGRSGGTTSKPCSNVTLADGTPATFVTYPNGVIQIVVNNDPQGNQFWFSVGRSDRDVFGNTYQDDNAGQWIDLATGTVHRGNRPGTLGFTKDDLLSATGSQGFLALYQQVAKDSVAH